MKLNSTYDGSIQMIYPYLGKLSCKKRTFLTDGELLLKMFNTPANWSSLSAILVAERLPSILSATRSDTILRIRAQASIDHEIRNGESTFDFPWANENYSIARMQSLWPKRIRMISSHMSLQYQPTRPFLRVITRLIHGPKSW